MNQKPRMGNFRQGVDRYYHRLAENLVWGSWSSERPVLSQLTQIISLAVLKAFMILSLSTNVKTTSNIPDNIPKVRSLFSGKVIFFFSDPQ